MADFPHFTLSGMRAAEDFTTPPSGGGEHETPPRPDRTTHADKLLTDLDRAARVAKQRLEKDPTREGLQFIPMRFAEGSDFDLKLKSLAGSETRGVRIISAREQAGRKEYLVAVSDSKVESLAKKFREYRDEDTGKGRLPAPPSIWRQIGKQRIKYRKELVSQDVCHSEKNRNLADSPPFIKWPSNGNRLTQRHAQNGR
jgi:hypothetical protein